MKAMGVIVVVTGTGITFSSNWDPSKPHTVVLSIVGLYEKLNSEYFNFTQSNQYI